MKEKRKHDDERENPSSETEVRTTTFCCFFFFEQAFLSSTCVVFSLFFFNRRAFSPLFYKFDTFFMKMGFSRRKKSPSGDDPTERGACLSKPATPASNDGRDNENSGDCVPKRYLARR